MKGATNRNATPNDATPEVVLSINGLREDAGFRSNLMLLNANDRIKNQPLTITAYDDAGQLAGTTTRSLRTLEMTQMSRVLSNYGLTSGRVTISVPQDPSIGDHPNVLAMATVIDNITGSEETGVYPAAFDNGVIETRFTASVLLPFGLSKLAMEESPLS